MSEELYSTGIDWGVPLSAAGDEPITEAGAAERFCRQHGNDVRFDHRQKRWLIYQAHRFVPDTDGAITRLALLFARAFQRDAADESDRQRADDMWKLARSLERGERLNSMLAFASKLPPVADSGERWDRDPFLLGCTNGVIDLRTGRLRPGCREDRITMSTGVCFDEAAECPRWERFIREISDDDPELITYHQHRLGYALTGSTVEHICWFDVGTGANGKSTQNRAVQNAFGDYAGTVSFATLEKTSNRSAIPNDIAALEHKRLVFASEVNEGVRLDEGRLKSLTGGDEVSARFLGREFFTFRPVLKLILSVNHKPVTTDDSFGFWRRVRLVPFDRTFAPERGLDETLQQERVGILAWAVRGCQDWQQHGLKHPTRVEAATQEYAKDSDPLARFLAEACEEDPANEIGAADFYKHYTEWADQEGLGKNERLTSTRFGTRMATRFKRVDGGKRVYHGIGRRGVV